MTLGLRNGQIEVRRSTPAGKYVTKRFDPTEEGGKECARHIVRILRTQAQFIGFSSDSDFPEDCGFPEDFSLAMFLKPFLMKRLGICACVSCSESAEFDGDELPSGWSITNRQVAYKDGDRWTHLAKPFPICSSCLEKSA
jgi:hypothetical protein